MSDFVDQGSIVRRIWGDSDLILLVFAGSAAEFALNRAVDWLFFTNKLPQSPIERLFSTARFAQELVFVEEEAARRTLERIRAIHLSVERLRGARIPEWAWRDVLYMLIDYSERAYRMLHRQLAPSEQQELYSVYLRVGEGLGIPDLPSDYREYRQDRRLHLERDLVYSKHTAELYGEYRRHLGEWRYRLLLEVQAALVPGEVRRLLGLEPMPIIEEILWMYGGCAHLGLGPLLRWLLMPSQYVDEVSRLDRAPQTEEATRL